MRIPTARAERARRCPTHKLKVRFRTHEDATRALTSIRRKSQPCPGAVIPVRAYKCPDCAGWHLTSRPAWDRAPAA